MLNQGCRVLTLSHMVLSHYRQEWQERQKQLQLKKVSSLKAKTSTWMACSSLCKTAETCFAQPVQCSKGGTTVPHQSWQAADFFAAQHFFAQGADGRGSVSRFCPGTHRGDRVRLVSKSGLQEALYDLPLSMASPHSTACIEPLVRFLSFSRKPFWP